MRSILPQALENDDEQHSASVGLSLLPDSFHIFSSTDLNSFKRVAQISVKWKQCRKAACM